MIKVLFVCSQNKLRSPTAEAIFADKQGWQVQSAGLDNDANVQLNKSHIDWADTIFVMEQHHKSKLRKRFKAQLSDKAVITLGIPDEYAFMDPDLVALLQKKVPSFI